MGSESSGPRLLQPGWLGHQGGAVRFCNSAQILDSVEGATATIGALNRSGRTQEATDIFYSVLLPLVDAWSRARKAERALITDLLEDPGG